MVTINGTLGQYEDIQGPNYHPFVNPTGSIINRGGPTILGGYGGQYTQVTTVNNVPVVTYFEDRMFWQFVIPGGISVTSAVVTVQTTQQLANCSVPATPICYLGTAAGPNFSLTVQPRVSLQPATATQQIALPPAWVDTTNLPAGQTIWLCFTTDREADQIREAPTLAGQGVTDLYFYQGATLTIESQIVLTANDTVLVGDAASGVLNRTLTIGEAPILVKDSVATQQQPVLPAQDVLGVSESVVLNVIIAIGETMVISDAATAGGPGVAGVNPVQLHLPRRTLVLGIPSENA